MRYDARADLCASLGRSLLATGAGAAIGLFVWMVLVVHDTSDWEADSLFALGVAVAAALGMSRQPMAGATLAAALCAIPVVAFDFPFLSVIPAMMVAAGGMLAWVSTQPLRRSLTARRPGGTA